MKAVNGSTSKIEILNSVSDLPLTESGSQTVYVEWSENPVQTRDLLADLDAKVSRLQMSVAKLKFQMKEVRYLLQSED